MIWESAVDEPSTADGPRSRPVTDFRHRLQLDVERLDGSRVRVRAVGELDLLTAPRLQEFATSLIDGGCTHIDLDLAAVPFCDVAGLNVLLAIQRRVKDRRGHLVIYEPCNALTRMSALLDHGALLTFAQG
jgi:anti-anti-sigma factor